MKDLKELVNMNIIETEAINTEKQKALTKLEARLKACPEQWLQQTKKFIEVIKTNISERDRLITKLRSLVHNYIYKDEAINPEVVGDILADLEGLDNKDTIACDIYQAVMDEEIIQ